MSANAIAGSLARWADLAEPPPTPHADDPVAWITDTLGEELWSAQRQIVESVRDHRRTTVRSCNAIGKSWTAARTACWWLATHKVTEAFVVTTAPTAAHLKAVLWREIGRAFESAHLPGRVTQTEWWMPLGTREELVAMGRKPSDYTPDAFQGIHADYVLVVIDEASGVPASIWDAAATLTANEGSRILAIGNPDNPAGEFAATHKPGSGWNQIHISAFDSPNFTKEKLPESIARKLISNVYIDERRKRWHEGSPLWQSKILGEFPESSEDGLIPYADIAAAQVRELEPERPVQLACDVARFGKDETVVIRARGPVADVVYTSAREDTMTTTGQLVRLRREHGASLIRVDAIGVGGGVVDRLAEIGEPVLGLDVGHAPVDPRFLNCRAEWYWQLRERFECGDISIPDDDDLANQLAALRYEYTSRGKIKIESKDDMAKRGLPSPDRADALMMVFATEPKKRQTHDSRAEEDYDAGYVISEI